MRELKLRNDKKPVHCGHLISKNGESRAESILVLEFNKCHSVITVQRFRQRYNQEPPNANNIRRWHRMFEETGCLCKGKTIGRPRVSAENVERIRRTYERSLQKSTYESSRELQMPQKTVWRVLRKRLKMKLYVIQLVQQLKQEDYGKCMNYATFMKESMEDETMADYLIFSDESTFHISGKVNQYNSRIWSTEKPSTLIEHEHDSVKVYVFCAISSHKLYSPFFFSERSVTSNVYLDMLERWIGRSGEADDVFCSWPPRSPDLTPCDFFLWGYVKDRVYVPRMSKTIEELKVCICNVLASVTEQMLQNVWREMDYRLDVVRVTKGSHIEHL
ncbi:hypothetical protein AVEN_165291-1 [Araneus ventricosus]|uniref:DUF4817 domain-containing protein n=1 Tax=Araneus ventricosus TaxID=182803 RepID=A0A4Y2AUV6_ARAVE|nr:hypothetical protein AVEN_165291-1 [Araneus ventricosus]